MLKIGITGGIGSGKSLVCDVFKTLGVPIYSSDLEAKKIVDENQDVKKELIELLGDDIYDQNGILNRKGVAEKVFKDSGILQLVNSIVHPAVRAHFLSWLEKQKEANYIIKEAAILIESGAYKDVDIIVTVYSPEELRIERVMKRDTVSRESVLERIQKQMNEEEKVKLSDYVIYNDDTQLVLPQIIKLHTAFCEGKMVGLKKNKQ